MNLNNENEIFSYLKYRIRENNVLLFNDNSYEKKILRKIKKGSFVENFGHNMPSPDYYSEEDNIMFDIMRVNDSEVKKTYNPIKIRENNIQKELSQNFPNIDNMNVFINSASFDLDENTYSKYIKQANRVIKDHIQEIPNWISRHPNIQNKGLLIADETECYFDGSIIQKNGQYYASFKKPITLHKPWNDKNFMEVIYKSSLDFIIWYNIFKPDGIPRQLSIFYPFVVIIDVRYIPSKYIDYSNCHLVCW